MTNTQKKVAEMRQNAICYSLWRGMLFNEIDAEETRFIYNFEMLIDTAAFFGAFDDIGEELTEEEEEEARFFAWEELERAYDLFGVDC